MWNAHSSVGVAQIVLYAPAVCSASYLFFRHGRPKMAWTLLLIFSAIRIGGGVMVILLGNDPKSTGLIIAAIALLNTGVAPLIVATLGFMRIILSLDFGDNKSLRLTAIATRALFLLGVILLVAGASLEGQYKQPDTAATGLKLVKAGYIVLTLIFVILLAFQMFFWGGRKQLSRSSKTILVGTAATAPFIIVRIAYAYLSIFRTSSMNSKWDALYGAVGPFVGMVLIMEWISVVIFVAIGLCIPPINKGLKRGSTEATV